MTQYQVEWEVDAEEELARIWLLSGRDPTITTAQAEADRLLSHDPSHYGKHMSEGLFRLQVTPLILTFSIDEDARIVEVSWVWWTA